jgi:hypothetical protein
VTSPTTAICEIAPTADTDQSRVFTLVIQSANPTTGDVAQLTYDNSGTVTERTVPLD